ncbi:MAG: prepilin-type N-terminal cleavage/methylation domain-containing protein [Gemmatimonadaceae bacterium]
MRTLPFPNRKAFSLVEILVAMLVFAILASIGLVRYRDMKARAYVASMKADLGELRIAQESHWSEHATYTADQSQLDWRPTTDVTVIIVSGDPLVGFDAEATHAAAQGIICRMYVGRAVSGTPSGEITC